MQKGIALRLNTMYNKNKTKARGAEILGSLHMKNTQSGRIALCGVLAALTVAILLAGTALGIGTYAAPMLASFLLIPALVEYGPRTALTQYVASAVLALLLVPDPELSLFYALVLGPYPAEKMLLDRIRPAVLRWVAKVAVFNGSVAVMYALLWLVFLPGMSDLMPGTAVLTAAFVLLCNLAFVMCDRAVAALTLVYRLRLRRYWKKRL